MSKIFIFADAASYHNGKPDQLGACAAIFVDEDWNELGRIGKAFNNTTNNFNELMGGLMGLDQVVQQGKGITKIEVVSDSEYFIKGMNERLHKWIQKGWKNSGGPVKNRELWESLLKYRGHLERNRISVKFTWYKGHLGKNITLAEDPFAYYQEKADSLAVEYKERALAVRNAG
jgi:ribonuclease HI